MEVQESDENTIWSLINKHPYNPHILTEIVLVCERDKKDYENLIRSYKTILNFYPLLHNYWDKYARVVFNETKQLSDAYEIYNQALQKDKLYFSVDMWLAYSDFVKNNDLENLRTVYEEAVKAVGHDYNSDVLWTSFVEYEVSAGRFGVFTRVFEHSIKNLDKYWQRFEDFKQKLSDNFLTTSERNELNSIIEDFRSQNEGLNTMKLNEYQHNVIRQILTRKYEKSIKNINNIMYFEEQINRHFFHFSPPSGSEVGCWLSYINSKIQSISEKEEEISKKENMIKTLEDMIEQVSNNKNESIKLKKDRVKVREELDSAKNELTLLKEDVIFQFERCLIPCALVCELWMKYLNFLLSYEYYDMLPQIFTRIFSSALAIDPKMNRYTYLFCTQQKTASQLGNLESFAQSASNEFQELVYSSLEGSLNFILSFFDKLEPSVIHNVANSISNYPEGCMLLYQMNLGEPLNIVLNGNINTLSLKIRRFKDVLKYINDETVIKHFFHESSTDELMEHLIQKRSLLDITEKVTKCINSELIVQFTRSLGFKSDGLYDTNEEDLVNNISKNETKKIGAILSEIIASKIVNSDENASKQSLMFVLDENVKRNILLLMYTAFDTYINIEDAELDDRVLACEEFIDFINAEFNSLGLQRSELTQKLIDTQVLISRLNRMRRDVYVMKRRSLTMYKPKKFQVFDHWVSFTKFFDMLSN